MWRTRACLPFAVAGLTAALLVSATGAGAGVVQVAAPSSVEHVVAYGRSQLLLIRPRPYPLPGITRINLNGSVDRSFGAEGTVEIAAEDATVTQDGKILLATSSLPPNVHGSSDARVTRLLPDGRPDSSFGAGGSADVDFGGRYDTAQSLALTANGGILLAGSRQGGSVGRGESQSSPALARLRRDGSVDRSFGRKGVRVVAGGGEIAALDVAPTPDGGVMVEIGNEIEAALLKLTGDGSVDTDFGKHGWFELRARREKPGYHEELFVAPSSPCCRAASCCWRRRASPTAVPSIGPGWSRSGCAPTVASIAPTATTAGPRRARAAATPPPPG